MNLAKNKKLVLSVALNVLFAVALSVLLYLVYPQLIYRLESVTNLWSRYSVRTYETDSGFAYLEVLRGHRRIYSCSGERQFLVETLGDDVTGNGMPNLVIRQWYALAHGDSKYLILELHDSAVREIDAIDGFLGAELRDLNNDGIREIAGTDRSYVSFLGESAAGSPLPAPVLSFDKTRARSTPDKKLMSKPPLPQDQLDRLSLEYKNDRRWSEASRPPSELFVTMLDLIYCGNEKQGGNCLMLLGLMDPQFGRSNTGKMLKVS